MIQGEVVKGNSDKQKFVGTEVITRRTVNLHKKFNQAKYVLKGEKIHYR